MAEYVTSENVVTWSIIDLFLSGFVLTFLIKNNYLVHSLTDKSHN